MTTTRAAERWWEIEVIRDKDIGRDFYDALHISSNRRKRHGEHISTVDFPYTFEGMPEIPVTVKATIYHRRDDDEAGNEREEIETEITELRLCDGTVVDEDDIRILSNLPIEYIEQELAETAIYYYEHPDKLDL